MAANTKANTLLTKSMDKIKFTSEKYCQAFKAMEKLCKHPGVKGTEDAKNYKATFQNLKDGDVWSMTEGKEKSNL